MKRNSAMAALLVLLSCCPAFSKEMATPTSVAKGTSDKAGPQIITDKKNNTVRIVIEGRDILTIDARGIHVTGSIEQKCPANLTECYYSPPGIPAISGLPPPLHENEVPAFKAPAERQSPAARDHQ